MLSTESMLNTLMCLGLNYAYEQVQYKALDMRCPEVEENKAVLDKITSYHRLLSYGCSELSDELLCTIENFVKRNPCTCPTCNSSCSTITITLEDDSTACGPIVIEEVDDP